MLLLCYYRVIQVGRRDDLAARVDFHLAEEVEKGGESVMFRLQFFDSVATSDARRSAKTAKAAAASFFSSSIVSIIC